MAKNSKYDTQILVDIKNTLRTESIVTIRLEPLINHFAIKYVGHIMQIFMKPVYVKH